MVSMVRVAVGSSESGVLGSESSQASAPASSSSAFSSSAFFSRFSFAFCCLLAFPVS